MRAFWQPPRLRRDAELGLERKATWLELFYDLVFVVIVSQLAHTLVGEVSWGLVGGFVLMFVPAWWLWIAGTFYAERFEGDDVSHRIVVFVSMLPVAALAVFTHGGMGATSREFGLAYAAGRTLVVFMWWRGGRQDPEAREMTSVYVRGFSAAVLIMLASAFLAPPGRFVAWGLALVVDLVTPFFSAAAQRKLPRLSLHHLAERFGLFTLIVLGESVVGVVNGLAGAHHLSGWGAAEAALGMAIAFAMWWIYFDAVATRAPLRGAAFTRSYLHLPLVMAFTATGAGITNVVAHPGAALPGPVRWLICGAVGTSCLVLAALCFNLAYPAATLPWVRRLRVLLLGVAGLALALAALGDPLGPAVIMAILVAALVAGAALASWIRHLEVMEPTG